MNQAVQVKFLDTDQAYSYTWEFEDGKPLKIGERVEVPPNSYNPEGSSGIVVGYGTTYTGKLAKIVRRVPAK
jgi:hypothetical protein